MISSKFAHSVSGQFRSEPHNQESIMPRSSSASITLDLPREPIPPFLAARALKSMRDAGFDLPTALGEVVDNSIEADANNIVIDMHEVPIGRKRTAVDRIAIADDGTGM